MKTIYPKYLGYIVASGMIAAVSFGMASCVSAAQADYIVPPTDSQTVAPVGAVPHGITVTGHASLDVMPDMAEFELSATTTAPKELDAVKGNKATISAIVQALEKCGIADKDIHMVISNVNPQSASVNVSGNRSDNKQAFNPFANDFQSPNGFSVTNLVDVTVRDLSKARLVIDKAVKAGATNVSIYTFDLSDPKKEHGEAVVAALSDARAEANLIATAEGDKLGHVLSVSELGAPTRLIFPSSLSGKDISTLSEQTILESAYPETVTAHVTVSYAIDYGNP